MTYSIKGNALNPKDIGLIRLQPVLILSKIEKHKKFAEEFINLEFDDYLYVVSLESLEAFNSTSLKQKETGSFESLKNYHLHLIEIFEEKAILTFRNGKKIEKEFEDLEKLLEEFGRELIAYYHKMMK